jgi:predicted secreted protein
MHWDKITNKIYITDLFANAVYSIDMNWKLELIAENNDTNGSAWELDGPSEVIVRNNQAIIMNFDAVFDDPRMINTKADEIHTLSVIQL